MIDAVLFLSTLVAIGVLAYWVFRHDGTPDDTPPGGILGMRGAADREAETDRKAESGHAPEVNRAGRRFRPRLTANSGQF
jgi:hypothetical protein